MSGNEPHTIQAEYQHHTDAALCVKIDADVYWFTLTTIEVEDPLISFHRGDKIELDVQEWMLIKHGLDWMIEG